AAGHPLRSSPPVNLAGLPSRRPVPDVANHDRTRMLATELAGWLDHRPRAAGAERKAGTPAAAAPRPAVAHHPRPRMLPTELAGWLDPRRRAADAERKPGTTDELARRRARM